MVDARSLRPFAFVIVGYLFVVQTAILVLALPIALSGRADFRHLYTAGYMVRSGHAHQLYDYESNREFQNHAVGPSDFTLPYNHPAYEALVFVPFSLFKYRTAYFAFFAVNLALLAVSFRLLRPYLGQTAELSRLLPAGLFVSFLPVTIALVQGQDSIILLTLFVAATVSLDRGHEMTAGAFIGLTLFKFQFGIPTALLFLVWRRWRFTAGFAMIGMAILVMSAWLTGFAGLTYYAHSLVSMGSAAGEERYLIHPEYMPNIRGLIYTWGSAHLSHMLVQATTAVCSALVLLCAATRRPTFPLAVTAALLVSYHGLIHDATLLIIPLGLALSGALESSTRRAAWNVSLVGVILAAPTVLFFWGERYYLLLLPIVAFFVIEITSKQRDDRRALASFKAHS